MPSKSKSQARLMHAVANGWHPDQIKGPTKKVAKEFTLADKAKSRKTKLDKWAQGPTKRRPDAWARARNDAKSNVGEYKT